MIVTRRPAIPLRHAALALALALLAGTTGLSLPAVAGDSAALSKHGMDQAVAPGDDFSRFANGGWESQAVIPAGHVRWGVVNQVREDNLKKMLALYEEAAKGGPATSPAAKKVGDYFAAQMDQAGIEARGFAPIKPLLDQIAALDSKSALAHFLGSQAQVDVDPINFGRFASENLFGMWVGPRLQDPKHYMPYLLQGGLAIPSEDTYLSADPAHMALREKYRNYIAATLTDAGIGGATGKADQILALEVLIAGTHASRKESADLNNAGQVWQRADFKSKASGFDWDAYFAGAGLTAKHPVGVWQPGAIKGIAAIVAATPLDVWKTYLSFHSINLKARVLPKSTADRFYAFYDPIIIGPGQQRPLWDRALNRTNADLPGAGQLFVERHLTPQGKAKAQEIVANVATAFGMRIDQQAWMTPAARMHARAKLRAMIIAVGAPDKWPDITQLEVRPDDAFGNAARAAAFNRRTALAKSGKLVDRTEWIRGGELFGINPMPLQNLLTVPVALLQQPFFDPNGSDAVNYASVGARVGAAIALGFDQEGSRFDARGRASTWWSEADRAQFDKASQALVAQYSAYKPFPDLAVNGARTLKNNLAELAGLRAAHDAYRGALAARQDKEDIKTSDQRFFLAYAYSLRLKVTDASLRGPTQGTPVAPPAYRVATVRNLDAWYDAFDVTPAQGLYLKPDERVRMW